MSVQLTENARNNLIEKYTPLVKFIASRIMVDRSKYMDFDDLVGYGYVGLMDAVNKYDSNRGISFSSYASIRIKGAMLDEIRKSRLVSRNAISKLIKYNEAIDKLQKELLREPTTQEIADELNLSLKDVSDIENNINVLSTISLEGLLYSDENGEQNIHSFLEDKTIKTQTDIIEDSEKTKILSKSIESLKENERLVLTLYYYEGLTLKEIGEVLDVTESRVCQIHSKAIVNLKSLLKNIKYID